MKEQPTSTGPFLVKGVIAGGGIGLLCCDWIDLSGGDYFAIYGWVNGVIMGVLIGAIIGFIRGRRHSVHRSDPSSASKPRVGYGWELLGLIILAHGVVIRFSPSADKTLSNTWATTMIIAGLTYLIAPRLLRLLSRASRPTSHSH